MVLYNDVPPQRLIHVGADTLSSFVTSRVIFTFAMRAQNLALSIMDNGLNPAKSFTPSKR